MKNIVLACPPAWTVIETKVNGISNVAPSFQQKHFIESYFPLWVEPHYDTDVQLFFTVIYF